MREQVSNIWKSNVWLAYVLLIPCFAFVIMRTVYPVFEALWITFNKIKIGPGMPKEFVGLNNWIRLFSDPIFWKTLKNTFYFSAVNIGIGFALAMVVALLLNQEFKGRNILRVLLIIPWAVPAVSNGLIWEWMYNGSYGVINGMLLKIGVIKKFHIWLGDPKTAMLSVIFAQTWKDMPFMALMLLAALQTVPQDLYDAADVDGASKWQRFWFVTVPSIKLPILFTLILQTINSIKVFDVIRVCTKGGPGDTTLVTYYYAYQQAFEWMNMGYGTTLAFVIFMVVFILTMIYLRLFSPEI